MTPARARLWKLVGGILGGTVGIPIGYVAATFLYVGARTAANPGFEPARADETETIALAGAVLAGALGSFMGVLTARVATGA